MHPAAEGQHLDIQMSKPANSVARKGRVGSNPTPGAKTFGALSLS